MDKQTKEIESKKNEIVTLTIRSNQSIAESNLMVIPFVHMQDTNIQIIKRIWVSNGIQRGLEVKGSVDLGVPTVKDLDTLMALFRILVKNMNFQYEYDKVNNKVFFDKEIHFTRRELALEMGYSSYSGKVKNLIDISLKRLNECTIYSTLHGSLRDNETGEYVTEFEELESLRILYDLKTYSYSREKFKGKKIGNAKTVKERTSVKIHDFFFKSMCNNYFKKFDYDKYVALKMGISKKLFLLLNQWSHGYEKYLTYQVMYDMLGLTNENGNIKDKQTEYYHNRQIRNAFKELKDISYIDDFYEIKSKQGINIIFSKQKLNKIKFAEKYLTDGEVVDKLQSIGFTIEDIVKYYRLDNSDYVRGLLRYCDFQFTNKKVVNYKKMLTDGLKSESYDLQGFI